jgi:hypothetical protein
LSRPQETAGSEVQRLQLRQAARSLAHFGVKGKAAPETLAAAASVSRYGSIRPARTDASIDRYPSRPNPAGIATQD